MANALLEKVKAFSSTPLFSSTESAVGLSIGSTSVKIVELKRFKKGWKLIHFGMIQLPEDVIVNREIINNIAVSDSIKTLVQQLKLKSKNVCTSLSGTSLIIKRMTLDVQNKNELKEQIFWEAEQYLPFDVSEVVMDYHVLSDPKATKTDVLLVAVKTSVLDSYINTVEDSGLKAKVIDVDFFALQHLFEVSYPAHAANQPGATESAALVDIGGSSLKISIVQSGVPVFTKDSSLGGKNLTAEIQKQLNLSYVDAETLKTGAASGAMPQEVGDLMHTMAENLATEIRRAIDFYNASSTGAPVASILLAGGCAKIPNLSRIIEEALGGIPTMIMNPFNAISFDPTIFTQDYLSAIAPLAAIPLGLALRGGSK